MTSPIRDLAKTLDDWSCSDRALITETSTDVVAARLAEPDARSLIDELETLGWQYSIEDGSQSPVTKADLDEDFQPYRVRASKPSVSPDQECVLTNIGLTDWLSRSPATSILQVCRLDTAFETFSVKFTPWGPTEAFAPENLTSDPRTVVKESGPVRFVPHDLSVWLLRSDQIMDMSNSSVNIWADHSARNIAMSLSNEVEHPDHIVFKGPPAARYKITEGMSSTIGPEAFRAMQECARWVFCLPKETETRHILLTAELSRSSPGTDEAAALFRSAASAALEGAKIAHELGLHKISADSLKALSDLRKAVSDEASKLGDSTRQLAGAVSSALFGGIALIVARLTLVSSNTAIAGAVLLIGTVLFSYVLVTIASGKQFVSLQRELREQWRDRLYRFLPATEYKKMVTDPAEKAEAAFHLASRISMVLATVLLVAVVAISVPELWSSFQTWRTTVDVNQVDHTEAKGLDNTPAPPVASPPADGRGSAPALIAPLEPEPAKP